MQKSTSHVPGEDTEYYRQMVAALWAEGSSTHARFEVPLSCSLPPSILSTSAVPPHSRIRTHIVPPPTLRFYCLYKNNYLQFCQNDW
jgi:hypothetical protein